jgi:hypothetical protein
MFRCWIVEVHAMIVKRQLQRISRVPPVSGEETKFVVIFGVVQEESKTV